MQYGCTARWFEPSSSQIRAGEKLPKCLRSPKPYVPTRGQAGQVNNKNHAPLT